MPIYPQFRACIDGMKYMKDTVMTQLPTAEKRSIVAAYKQTHNNYVGFSVPLAPNAAFIAAGSTPLPRTIEDEWLDWCNVIHDAGLGIIFRSAFPGMEGIYGFQWKVGGNRYPAGTAAQVLGTPFTDDYNRVSVGSNYTTAADGGTGNTWTILNGELRGPAADGWRRTCLTTQTYTDFTVTAKIKKVGNQQIVVRATTNSNFPGYGFQIRNDSGGRFRLERPGLENIAEVAKTWVEGSYYQVKVQCSGTTIRGKVWLDGTSEPGGWDISVTRSDFASGLIGFSGESSNGIFDDLAITPVADKNNWCGIGYDWIINNPNCFNDTGPHPDVWAIAPERTENIFNDNTAFLPNTGPGLQQNFVDFYYNLAVTASAAFAAIGKPNVITGDTANNYSEPRSGWIPQEFFENAGRVAVDYYLNYSQDGNFTPARAVADIALLNSLKAKRVAWQEYGPLETAGQPMAARATAMRALLDQVYTDLVVQGILEEMNFWMGWDGQNTSMLNKTGSGASAVYTLNELGLEVQRFFNQITPPAPPVVTPPTIGTLTRKARKRLLTTT